MDNFKRHNSQPRRALDGFVRPSSRPLRATPEAPKVVPKAAANPAPKRTIAPAKQNDTTSLRVNQMLAQEGVYTPKTTQNTKAPVRNPWPEKIDELPPAEGKKSKKKRHMNGATQRWSRSRRIWITLAVVFGLLLLIGGFLVAKGYLNLHRVFKGGSNIRLSDSVDPSTLNKEGDSRVNFLILGRGGEGHDGADLTDTILVASIDPVTNRVDMVSLPRDLWVKSDYGNTKINAVYANAKNRALSKKSDKKAAEKAGIDAIRAKTSEVLGVYINSYAMVDFKAFEEAVNTVGGVDVNVTEETAVQEHLWDPIARKPYYLNVQPGNQHFDGRRALFYARSRHTSPRGDFDRSERQRLLLQALTAKVTSAGTYTNPVKISQLLDNFGSHVSTDLSINDVMALMEIGKKASNNVNSLDLAKPGSPIMETGNINGQSIVRPVAGLFDYKGLQEQVRTAFKDGYIVRENAVVKVVNGTSVSGLATNASTLLRSYGYNIHSDLGTATNQYDKTVLVDLTGDNKKPYTRNYLEKRYGVKALTAIPNEAIDTNGVDFVIILGRDEAVHNEN